MKIRFTVEVEYSEDAPVTPLNGTMVTVFGPPCTVEGKLVEVKIVDYAEDGAVTDV